MQSDKKDMNNISPLPSEIMEPPAYQRETFRNISVGNRVSTWRFLLVYLIPCFLRASMAGARRVTGSNVAPYSRALIFATYMTVHSRRNVTIKYSTHLIFSTKSHRLYYRLENQYCMRIQSAVRQRLAGDLHVQGVKVYKFYKSS